MVFYRNIDWMGKIKDPIVWSIVLGNLAFIIAFLYLRNRKPKAVTKENRKVNWAKLVTISFIIGFGGALISFLILNPNSNAYVPVKKAKMEFSSTY